MDGKKTSAEWSKYLKDGVIIYDPDGWDRRNYDYSFNQELITRKEFEQRFMMSTVQRPKYVEGGDNSIWKTDYNTLPRKKMETITIAFDVDGTLRCNCSDTCEDPNMKIVRMFNMLADFKNTEMYVWSGGGADYARRFADLYGLKVAHKRCISKFSGFKPIIAIDDIQDTALGEVNLIVREK